MCKLDRASSKPIIKSKTMITIDDFNNEMLFWVVVLLGLRMATNRVVGNNYATHDGSISPRLAFFVCMHSKLMDISSPANRRKAVIDVGSGSGNVAFVASSQSHSWRTVIGIEIVPERVSQLLERVERLRGANAPFAIPTIVHGDFAARGTANPYTAAIDGGPVIMWLNNGQERLVTYSVPNLQGQLEDRLRDCREGSILVSMSRCFRGDRSWHEEGFKMSVLPRDVSWRSRGEEEDEFDGLGTEIEETLFKYTKRSFPQPLAPGESPRRRRDPAYERLTFPTHQRIGVNIE